MIDKHANTRTKRSRFSVITVAIALAATTALAGCLSDNGGGGSGGDGDAQALTIVTPNWSGEEIRSYMVREILENELGYTVTMNLNVDPGAAYQSVASDNADIFVGAWLPIQNAQYEQTKDDLTLLADNLAGPDVTFGLAVPQYVYDSGVTSVDQLTEYTEEFGGEIYGIEPGAGMSATAVQHMENDLYGLASAGWEYTASSEAAMLTQYQNAVDNQEFVVVTAWSPHFMFAKWQGDNQMVYLEDPGDPEQDGQTFYAESSEETRVATLVSDNLMENHPDARAFLENFQMSDEDESQLMLQVTEGATTEEVALQYLEENPDKVQEWLSGVNTDSA